MTKKKLLIINKAQFGYHIDTYYYCKHLEDEYDITYLCFETTDQKILNPKINIIYVDFQGNIFLRGYRFLKIIKNIINDNHYDLIFTAYFQGISFLKNISPDNMILDIRTGAVGKTKLKRLLYNKILRYESQYFKYITVISSCLKEKLNLKDQDSHILPLGSDKLSTIPKSFDSLNLIYVGTLNARNIHETVQGLRLFLDEIVNLEFEVTYDIFGRGTVEDELILNRAITLNKLENIVKFHGWKNHDELSEYFNKANIGISYIPITDYFDCQPPTKTFEYINSGMICIGTKTKANIGLITSDNGLLCNDTSGSFSKALSIFIANKQKYNSSVIASTLNEYTWKNIINNNLKRYLQSILEKKNI